MIIINCIASHLMPFKVFWECKSFFHVWFIPLLQYAALIFLIICIVSGFEPGREAGPIPSLILAAGALYSTNVQIYCNIPTNPTQNMNWMEFWILTLYILQSQFQSLSLSQKSFSLCDYREPIRIMFFIFLLLYLNNLVPLGSCAFPSPLNHINLFASMEYFLKATKFYV